MTNYISQIETKTAEVLSKADLIDDWDHNNIKRAAESLNKHGFGHFVYKTQYGSGSSVWLSPETSLMVDANGVIHFESNHVLDMIDGIKQRMFIIRGCMIGRDDLSHIFEGINDCEADLTHIEHVLSAYNLQCI